MKLRILALLALLPSIALAQVASRSGRQTIGTDLSTFTVTPSGTTTPRPLAKKLGDVVSLKDFGCKGDGTGDDTACVQAAIATVLGPADPLTNTRTATAAIRAPCGVYNVSASTSVVSALGLHFYGDGECTVFKVVAPIAGAVFDLDGVSRSKFEDFSITGSNVNTFNDGIALYWDTTIANRSTAYVMFSNISVAGKFVNGFRVGKPGVSVQESETQWYSCRVIGQWTAGEVTWWQTGFLLGSGVYGNNLDHALYAPEISNVRYGVFNNTTNVSVYGGMIQANEEDLRGSNIHGFFHAEGFRSENSQRLIDILFASNPKNVSVSHVQWNITANAAADHRVVEYLGTGTLKLEEIEFHTGTTGYAPVAWINTPGNATVILEGIHLGGTGSTLANFVQGSANVSVYARGIEEMDDNNASVTQWGQVLFSDLQFGTVNAAAPATAPDVKLKRSAAGVLQDVGGLNVLGGLTVSTLGAPTNATFTQGTGTLATGTYFYRVAANNAAGQTLASTETSVAITGPAGVNVNWTAVPGATGYSVYGRTTGAELRIGIVSGGSTTTFLDDGSITPSGALPSVDTTAVSTFGGALTTTGAITTGSSLSAGGSVSVGTTITGTGASGLTISTQAATDGRGLRNNATRNIIRNSSVAPVDCAGAPLTLTIAQFLDAAVFTCATAQTITLPTWQGAPGTGTVQSLPGTRAVGDVVQWEVCATAANALTLAAGTGGTFVSSTTVPGNSCRMVQCRVTSVTASAETASCY